jgi:hypothetical protein
VSANAHRKLGCTEFQSEQQQQQHDADRGSDFQELACSWYRRKATLSEEQPG